MSDWGGAQWLIIFVLTVRAILGLLVLAGRLQQHRTVAEPLSPGVRYASDRVGDVLLVAVLWWGGFW